MGKYIRPTRNRRALANFALLRNTFLRLSADNIPKTGMDDEILVNFAKGGPSASSSTQDLKTKDPARSLTLMGRSRIEAYRQALIVQRRSLTMTIHSGCAALYHDFHRGLRFVRLRVNDYKLTIVMKSYGIALNNVI